MVQRWLCLLHALAREEVLVVAAEVRLRAYTFKINHVEIMDGLNLRARENWPVRISRKDQPRLSATFATEAAAQIWAAEH